MCKLGIDEWLVSAVMSMYVGAKQLLEQSMVTVIMLVKVGMRQGSVLSQLLFVIVTEAISKEFQDALPWELLYVDDLIVIAESEEELIKKLTAE